MTTAFVVLALALVCLLAFFIIETRPKKTLSMLDLAEFKDLPGELRTIIKSMMPNPSVLKKHWAHMNPQQKQSVIQQLTSQIPRGPQQPQQDNRPPAPSYVIKHEREPEPEAVSEPEISEVEPEPESGLKPGFLLTNSVDKSQKKNAKNKKKDKVVTFSDIGTTEDEEPVPADSADL